MQHAVAEIDSTTWCRFTGYELVGHHIRPTRDAELRPYNPWLEYERHLACGRGGGMHAPPYESLLNLAELQSAQRAGWRLDRRLPKAEGPRLLDWCRENGLLGLFFTEVRQLTLYPRWRAMGEGNACEAAMLEYSCGERWIATCHSYSSLETALLPAGEKVAGALVANLYWSAEWPSPGALIQTLDTGLYHTRPLRDLGCYFPAVADPETYPYPLPASQEFWRAYAEDVDALLRLAFSFAEAVRMLAETGGGSEPAGGQLSEARHALAFLNRLAAGADSGFCLREDGAIEPCRRTPSLVGAFARMALLDFARGWIQVCGRCARVFVSSAGKARFCSPRCRYAVQRRIWRAARLRKAGLLPAAGSDRAVAPPGGGGSEAAPSEKGGDHPGRACPETC